MSLTTAVKKIMFKNPKTEINQSEEVELTGNKKNNEITENPYLASRRTWNNHVMSVVSGSQIWQLIGILSLLIVLASVSGLIYVGSKSKFIPYVVEVDKLGSSQASGIVNSTVGSDPRLLSATVSEFIENARLVSPDIALQRKAIFNIYAHLSPNDPATIKMNEWLNGTNDSSPFKRAAKEMVSIDITSVLPQTNTTWQVDWVETTRDRKGILKGEPAQMRGLVTVYQAKNNPNITDEDMRKNPLSIYVRDFSWSLLN